MTQAGVGSGNAGWFTHVRFGMFLYWYSYSLGPQQDWVKSLEKIEDEVFDSVNWAEAVQDTEIKYLVMTTRHHDGIRADNAVTPDLPHVPPDVTIPVIEILLN